MLWSLMRMFKKVNKLELQISKCRIYTSSMCTRPIMTFSSLLTSRLMQTGKRTLFKSKLLGKYRLTTPWESLNMSGGRKLTIRITHLSLVSKASLIKFQKFLLRSSLLNLISLINLSLKTTKYKKKLHLCQTLIRPKLRLLTTQLIIFSLIYRLLQKSISHPKKQISSSLNLKSTWPLWETIWMSQEWLKSLLILKLTQWDLIKVWLA